MYKTQVIEVTNDSVVSYIMIDYEKINYLEYLDKSKNLIKPKMLPYPNKEFPFGSYDDKVSAVKDMIQYANQYYISNNSQTFLQFKKYGMSFDIGLGETHNIK